MHCQRWALIYYLLSSIEEDEDVDESDSFRDNLTLEELRRRDRRIPRVALQDPHQSPWTRLFDSHNDQALITVTGLCHASFAHLEELFTPYFEAFTPHGADTAEYWSIRRLDPNRRGGGRPRLVTARSCLGLSLAYYRFRGGSFALQVAFGLTGTNLGKWLWFGRRVLIEVLNRDPSFQPIWPDDAMIFHLQQVVEARHPLLKNVFAVGDGLKLLVESAGDRGVQNRYYNGWQHGTYVTNLFFFTLDGKIVKCVLNCCGSIHDMTLANFGNVYEELADIHERTQGIVVLDSAFAGEYPFVIRSSQNVNMARDEMEMVLFQEATSLRQSAEWGMRALQGAFPRLKDRMRYEERGDRVKILQCMVLLHNYRVHYVGMNQIQSTYYFPHFVNNPEDLFA